MRRCGFSQFMAGGGKEDGELGRAAVAGHLAAVRGCGKDARDARSVLELLGECCGL